VATLAQETCVLHPRLNSDLLISAAIVHDIGKTREFELGAEIALSEEGRLIGHLALGQQLVAERAAALDSFPAEKLLALSHCILTHHGPDGVPSRRFGSPEALALYRVNALDAAVKGALEHGLSP
jgi:3'-5' exoribonuclease